eukprot:952933-Amphidinium_carterae.1
MEIETTFTSNMRRLYDDIKDSFKRNNKHFHKDYIAITLKHINKQEGDIRQHRPDQLLALHHPKHLERLLEKARVNENKLLRHSGGEKRGQTNINYN